MEYIVLFPDGRTFGPADVSTLAEWARQGRLMPETMLESLSTRTRVSAASVAGIFPPGTAMPPSGAGYTRYFAPPSQNNGMAVAALILGVVSLPFAIVPCFWPIAAILAVLAIVFGMVARSGSSPGLGLAGLICGLVTLLITALWLLGLLSMTWRTLR